jgi:hypothetical protein
MEVVPPESAISEALSIKNRHDVATTLYVPLPPLLVDNDLRVAHAAPRERCKVSDCDSKCGPSYRTVASRRQV